MEQRLYQDLRGRMTAEGYTIERLARRTGVSESHLNNILAGRAWPRLDLCYDILKELGVSPEELVYYFPPEGKRIPRPAVRQPERIARGQQIVHVGTGRRYA